MRILDRTERNSAHRYHLVEALRKACASARWTGLPLQVEVPEGRSMRNFTINDNKPSASNA
jgi:hypothetical protein